MFLRSSSTGATTAAITRGVPFTVGRAVDAQLCLPEPFISRRHAELNLYPASGHKPPLLALRALASAHSGCVVHLNGIPVKPDDRERALAAGDVIAFAPGHRWEVIVDAADAAPAVVASVASPPRAALADAAPATEPAAKRARRAPTAEEDARASATPPIASAPSAPAESEDDGAMAMAHVECPICREPLAVAVTITCGHALCHECAVGLEARGARERETVKCPVCRAPHTGAARRCFALDSLAAARAARALSPASLGAWRARVARGRSMTRADVVVAGSDDESPERPDSPPRSEHSDAESEEAEDETSSHPELLDPYWMNVAELRDELGHRGLDVTGRKPQLVERLEAERVGDGPTVRLNGRVFRTYYARWACAECGVTRCPLVAFFDEYDSDESSDARHRRCCVCRGAPRREICRPCLAHEEGEDEESHRSHSVVVVDDESDAESDDDSDAERARSLENSRWMLPDARRMKVAALRYELRAWGASQTGLKAELVQRLEATRREKRQQGSFLQGSVRIALFNMR